MEVKSPKMCRKVSRFPTSRNRQFRPTPNCEDSSLFIDVFKVLYRSSSNKEYFSERIWDFHLGFGQFCEKITRNIRRI